MTTDEVVDFARQWDPQWFHTDVAEAANGPYVGLIAGGIHMIALFQRLLIAACGDWANIAGARIRDLRFLRPMRPGQTVTAMVSVVGIEHEDARRRALVTTKGELYGSEGKPLLTMTSDAYMHQAPRRG